MNKQDPSRYIEPKRTTAGEVDRRIALEKYITDGFGTNVEKMQNFAKYVPTQDLRRFLCRTDIFKKILSVHGSIIECGIHYGGGLMTWAQLSEIFEPLNHTRNIIGFDTFSGFPSVSEKDRSEFAEHNKEGGLALDVEKDLEESIRLYNDGRLLRHLRKVRMVKGDANKTIPEFLEENPHTVVALLHLDFDIYEPTLTALKHFVPRMPKGGIIVFDELNHEVWPGETAAVMEELGLNELRVQRFSYGGTLSYAILE